MLCQQPWLVLVRLLIKPAAQQFVALVGEQAAFTVGLTTLARIISVTGSLANTGNAIYGMARNPAEGVIGLLGALSAVRLAVNGGFIAMLSDVRNLIPPETIESLGSTFADNDNALRLITSTINLI
jgi:hypothetical protein